MLFIQVSLNIEASKGSEMGLCGLQVKDESFEMENCLPEDRNFFSSRGLRRSFVWCLNCASFRVGEAPENALRPYSQLYYTLILALRVINLGALQPTPALVCQPRSYLQTCASQLL